MEALIGNTFKTENGTISLEELQASCDVIAVYFSAHWCPPCRGFTPVLVKFYNEVNASGKKLEIVFGSIDQSEDQFNEYFKEMPWVAIPFGDPKIRGTMNDLGIQGIPNLKVFKKDGSVTDIDGRSDVQGTGPSVISDWISKTA